MFDLFGSVFGRSKKSSSALQNSSKNEEGPSEESFVVVKDHNADSPLYPALNFDQLRVNNDQASSPLNRQKIGLDKHHFQPLDNVPFVPNPNQNSVSGPTVELSQCFATIERVGFFLSSSHNYFQSEKNFLKQYQDN